MVQFAEKFKNIFSFKILGLWALIIIITSDLITGIMALV